MPATTPELEESQRRCYRVKRSAFAFVQAIDAAQDLGEQPLRLDAAGEQMAMISVRGEEIVVGAQAREGGHASGLRRHEMVMAAEHALSCSGTRCSSKWRMTNIRRHSSNRFSLGRFGNMMILT
jgi:hypothetical protein